MILDANEVGIFFKGGSIIPKLAHKRELSLMKAINNPIILDVRVDQQRKAEGLLTVDDGITTMDTRSDISFEFDGNILSYTVTKTP